MVSLFLVASVRELWRDLGRSGRAGVIAGVVGLLVVVPLLFVGPLARSALARRAADRGLACEVGAVRLGFRGIWLRDVALASASPSRVTARFDAVLVPYTGGRIEVHGGRVGLRGAPSEVRDAVRAKRAPEARAGGERRELSVDGVDVVWSELGRADAAPAYAWGIALERTASSDRVRFDLASVGTNSLSAEARGGEVTLGAGAGPGMRQARLRALDVSVELGGEPTDRRADDAPATIRASAGAGSNAPGWAGAVSALRAALGQTFADGAKVEVEALRARLGYQRERLGFGPSRVTLGRDAREVTLAVAPSERLLAGNTPLSVGLRLPLAEGEPSLEIEGGPVGLAALGVRDGDLGLRRVRDATLEAHFRVELSSGSQALRGSGSGRLSNLSLARPEIAPSELSGLGVAFRAAGEARLDGSRVVVDDAELGIGDVRLGMSLSAERDEQGLHVRSKGGVPLASCDAMLASLPKVLVAELGGLTLEGTFTLSYDIDYVPAKPNATRVLLDVKNDCRVKNVPQGLSAHRFRSAWVREVKGVDGQSVMVESGPGAPGWVPYDGISRFMEIAVLVCEDGGFYRHRGFDFRAIARAMEDDIRAGRFVRGASTISMQLAKNLYLGREKTLARKIQEALLTLLLEQELAKKELMEIYLNVVELGPGIYGVGPAAEHYFKLPAKDLSLGQALYLASILPDPTRQHFTPNGEVTERWSEYLRKLMRIARKVERITDDELEAGLAETIGFRQAAAAPSGLEASRESEEAPELPSEDSSGP